MYLIVYVQVADRHPATGVSGTNDLYYIELQPNTDTSGKKKENIYFLYVLATSIGWCICFVEYFRSVKDS